MEKFSKFNDPLTGINPFISIKSKRLSFTNYVNAFLKAPIYILYLLGLPVLPLLIRIRVLTSENPSRIIFANSVSQFDKEIIRNCFGNINVIFPEGASTNNRGVLKYEGNCDYVIGLKYSESCIYMYGSRWNWLLNFLSSTNTVDVRCIKGNELERAVNVPKLSFDKNDKFRFMELVNEQPTKKQ